MAEFSVSIVGESTVLTEALAIALRTRGLPATAFPPRRLASPAPVLSPRVLVLAGYSHRERLFEQLGIAREVLPGTKILVLCGSLDLDPSEFLLMGAAHQLFTAGSFDQLSRILEMLRQNQSATDSSLPELTNREQEVFQSIAAGLSNKEIANLLSISTCTVKNHVHSILTKLQISRRYHALGRIYAPRFPASEPEVCSAAD